ncbi:MAG: phosphatase PAP2 family protein [Chloroflexi bacterium]|nr:phosphatase PAP2 family protein [Chloroflexota bacterium]
MLQRILAWDAALTARLRLPEDARGWRTLAALLAHSGDSWFWLAGLGVVWAVGPAAWRERAGVAFVAVFVTAGVVLGLKFLFRRQRPEGTWGQIYRATDPHSFPSGHAARGALLTVLAWGLISWQAGLLVAVWAGLMALARVAMGVHYLSDVLAGMLLGALLGGLTLALR